MLPSANRPGKAEGQRELDARLQLARTRARGRRRERLLRAAPRFLNLVPWQPREGPTALEQIRAAALVADTLEIFKLWHPV